MGNVHSAFFACACWVCWVLFCFPTTELNESSDNIISQWSVLVFCWVFFCFPTTGLNESGDNIISHIYGGFCLGCSGVDSKQDAVVAHSRDPVEDLWCIRSSI